MAWARRPAAWFTSSDMPLASREQVRAGLGRSSGKDNVCAYDAPGSPLLVRMHPEIGRDLALLPRQMRMARDGLGCQNSAFHGLWQRNRAEERLGVEIVFAGFVDNPQHAEFLGSGVAQRYIDLAPL